MTAHAHLEEGQDSGASAFSWTTAELLKFGQTMDATGCVRSACYAIGKDADKCWSGFYAAMWRRSQKAKGPAA